MFQFKGFYFFLILLTCILFPSNYSMAGYSDYFVTQEYLKKNIDNKNIVLIDAREGNAYEKGHIKGAVPIRWKEISNLKPEFSQKGWGTVTDTEKLSRVIANSGISRNSKVIIYADTIDGWGEEGRIFWSLKIAGINDLRMLDGGIDGWKKSGGKLYYDNVKRENSGFSVTKLNPENSIDTETLKRDYLTYKIIDSRTLKEFKGARKFGEKRGGHLPGAVLIPYKSLLKDGYLKKPSELIKLLELKGINKEDKLVTYCTAGIRSAYVQVVLEMLGYDIKNYDESFYVWASQKDTGLGTMDGNVKYNYITEEQLRKIVIKSKETILVDIQTKEDYRKFHYDNSMETYASPVKTESDIKKLAKIIPELKASEKDIIIINPDDEVSSVRAFTFLVKEGINPARIYVLGRGNNSWWIF